MIVSFTDFVKQARGAGMEIDEVGLVMGVQVWLCAE